MGSILDCCRVRVLGIGRSRKGGYCLLEGCQSQMDSLLRSFAFLQCWITNAEMSVILYHTKNWRYEFTSPAACYTWFKFSSTGFLVKMYSIFNLTFPKSEKIWYFLADLCLCPHKLRWKVWDILRYGKWKSQNNHMLRVTLQEHFLCV